MDEHRGAVGAIVSLALAGLQLVPLEWFAILFSLGGLVFGATALVLVLRHNRTLDELVKQQEAQVAHLSATAHDIESTLKSEE